MRPIYFGPFGAALATWFAAMPAPGLADWDTGFVANEVQVSDPWLIDPEFDSISNLLCYTDRRSNLWLGFIDPATGLLDPPSGRGVLLARDSALVGQIGNGPEFVYTESGPQVIYTRLVNGVPALGRAFFDGIDWRSAPLQQAAGRLGPLGSLDRGDPTPTISYQGPKVGNQRPIYVRELNDASTEQMIPTTDEFRTPGARSIPESNAVIFTRPMPEDNSSPRRQVFSYDRDTQQLEQLTFDGGNKIAAFMWQAPEYDNEYVFFALLNERALGIYRYLDDDGDGVYQWTRVTKLDPPSLGEFTWSPEPFVYEGKSYIVMVRSTTDDQQNLLIPSEIWMTDIDTENPLYRRLSNDDEVNRKDPEFYFSDNGPYIYISRADGTGPVIMRLDTGLGPQTQLQ